MTNNGMTFGLEGPNITGWWVNPKTGDKFNAIDTFFEDNNLIIKTADGRMLNYNQIQNYIQTNNPDSVTPQKQTNNPSEDAIPANILAEIESNNKNDDIITPDNDIWDQSKGLGNIYREEKSQVTNDYDIINRALKGKGSLKMKTDISWDSFPQREIEMLIDVMNIPEEDIVKYFIDSVSMDDILKSIQDSIHHYINKKLHPTQEKTIETETKKPIEKKEKTKKNK